MNCVECSGACPSCGYDIDGVRQAARALLAARTALYVAAASGYQRGIDDGERAEEAAAGDLARLVRR